jgi:hypothetical protein
MSIVKYKSKYSNSEVTAAQYITELICEKLAQKKQTDLPQKFWTLPEWKRFFAQQVISANSLLKLYSATAIIRALRNKAAFGIYSLRAPHLDSIIELEETKLKAEVKTEIQVEKTQGMRPKQDKSMSIIGKLDG